MSVAVGSVQRSATQKLSERPSFLDFGAKGDGVADDTDAIYAATSYVAVNGGRLDVPKGVYLFNPSVRKFILGSNMVVEGCGTIKVHPDSGDYGYIMAPAAGTSAHIENLTISGITIDQNVLNNSSTITSDAETKQLVMLCYDIENALIERLTVYASGVNTFVLNGANVRSIRIIGNAFTFQKREAQAWFDNSCIYIHGDHWVVGNNHFYDSSEGGGTTAIEVQGGAGSVTGNVAEWYETLVVAANTKDVSIVGNSARKVITGVLFFASTGDSTYRTHVSGNTFSINNVEREALSYAGVKFYIDEDYAGPYDQIAINGNLIEMEQESTGRTVYASGTGGVIVDPQGAITNLEIRNNLIINPTSIGIKVGNQANTPGTGTISRCRVEGNTIIDPGTNLLGTFESPDSQDFWSAGIYLNGDLSYVTAQRNIIRSTLATFRGYYSIVATVYGGHAFSHVSLSDNEVTVTEAGKEYAEDIDVSVENGAVLAAVKFPGVMTGYPAFTQPSISASRGTGAAPFDNAGDLIIATRMDAANRRIMIVGGYGAPAVKVWIDGDTGNVAVGGATYTTHGLNAGAKKINAAGYEVGGNALIASSGMLKGSSFQAVAATAGVDYQAPLTSGVDYQPPLPSITGKAGKSLSVKSDETGIEWAAILPTFTGNGGKTLKVKVDETGVEWV